MSNNNDNLENKPQILPVVSGNKLLSGTKLKQAVAHATGNKLKRVAAQGSGNKLRQLLDSLKVSNKSSQNLPKIVGDIRHYPPANKE